MAQRQRVVRAQSFHVVYLKAGMLHAHPNAADAIKFTVWKEKQKHSGQLGGKIDQVVLGMSATQSNFH